MFKKFLLFLALLPLYCLQSAWGGACLEPNIGNSYVTANPGSLVVINGSTPDGTVVASVDISLPFAVDLQGCENHLAAGAATPLATWVSVLSGYATNSAGQPLAGYDGYFAVDSIPGLYYQVVNPLDVSQVAITTRVTGQSGPPLIMGDSPWTPCANYAGPTASCLYTRTASEYRQLPLKARVNFIKFGQLIPGDYDMNSHYLFHFIFAALPNDGHTNAEDVRLNSGVLVFRVKTNCELDTSSTDLSVDFGELDDKGVAVGQRLVPYDKDFEIGFHGCADSVLPAITWDLNAGDLVDVNGNFPTYTPGFGSGVSAGIGFKLFDKSAGQFAPVTPGVRRTLMDTAANVVVDGKMRYPTTQTTVKWPFAVRLIKSGTVPLGTFSGRATFTVAYP